MSLDLQSLISRLNPTCREALESGAQLCVAHTHFNVEIEHLLLQLLAGEETDVGLLIRHYGVRSETLQRELTRAIERFKRGNTRTPALSAQIIQLLEQAWLLSSLRFNAGLIRSGAILLAVLDHDPLRALVLDASPALRRFPRSRIKTEIDEILRMSGEDAEIRGDLRGFQNFGNHGGLARPSADAPRSGPAGRGTEALDQFTIDLTDRARRDLIDPIQGRDGEIRQIIDILTRRRQNNPILTGEAGVGKTAVVEGFAIRIVKGDVPPSLKTVSLRLLDLGLLQAGAGIRGEFEKRLKSVIDEVKSAARPTILFIDEAHTMIGAGGQAGMGDAANLLKPALARGELRTIAATTWSEYKKYFEKDPALARRFQVVKVDEPDEGTAVDMLRGVAAHLADHHRVTVLDEAVREAVRLSHRFITGRQLPDKAVSVLDTACARVAIGQNATPPEVEDLARRADLLTLEVEQLRRETAAGAGHGERIEALTAELDSLVDRRSEMEARWASETELVTRILAIRKKIEGGDNGGPLSRKGRERLHRELTEKTEALAAIQGESPMVPVCVDSRVVAAVISNWTGIPVGKMLRDELDTVLTLKERLARRVIGQDAALDTLCRRIQTYRADLDDPGKPVGVFLLVGPSGIGKTETAVTLADVLYGGERNLITINMSEYQESYTVSGLKGSPPGYVGYGTGGVLTEAVRKRPYSVVLLDEVEKAHPDVMELFYQVFDKGIMEDAEGLVIDFKNTVILLTSNVGSDILLRARAAGEPPEPSVLTEAIRPALLRHFKPALLGRLVIVPYYPLSDEVIRKIVQLKMVRIQDRFRNNHRVNLTYSEDLVAEIAARCTEVDTGARNVDHILTQVLLPEMSREMLRRMAVGQAPTAVHLDIDAEGGFSAAFSPALGAEGNIEPSDAEGEPESPEDETDDHAVAGPRGWLRSLWGGRQAAEPESDDEDEDDEDETEAEADEEPDEIEPRPEVTAEPAEEDDDRPFTWTPDEEEWEIVEEAISRPADPPRPRRSGRWRRLFGRKPTDDEDDHEPTDR